ncbi:spermatogenesis-associated protein 4 isoform X2 [Hydra vulgaris]|uniref:spermatogenesis-associated protein 4 isoform X2 n=1 Tax=Hydra vulgaris TaxID=6087 RepID=UPI001F5F325F|nr:spermatogenesis-associated protein 4-like isoform X2 [Hydra vulgaris]
MMRMAHVLPREVLKWLQSLELSYPIHNSKRDFSNGYLIAEIFSWYYPQEIQMHMFQNGKSIESKISNWSLLQKLFNRLAFNIPKEEIDATIHCKSGAAVLLLQRIYMTLTQRSVPAFVESDIDFSDNGYQQKLPFHARCTATKAVKNNITETELFINKDTIACTKKAEDIIRSHINNRHQQRLDDPDRFGIKPTICQRSPRKLMCSNFIDDCKTSDQSGGCVLQKSNEVPIVNEINVKQHLAVSSLSVFE